MGRLFAAQLGEGRAIEKPWPLYAARARCQQRRLYAAALRGFRLLLTQQKVRRERKQRRLDGS